VFENERMPLVGNSACCYLNHFMRLFSAPHTAIRRSSHRVLANKKVSMRGGESMILQQRLADIF